MHSKSILFVGLLLIGCSDYPDLPPTAFPDVSSAEGFPAFLAVNNIPAGIKGTPNADINSLQARAAALRARAQQMRRPVLTASERKRLQRR